ncbi:hypothetical protein CVIRNUC_010048 [Coccomyxa viridis]|uniref:FAD-binding domain-containing protein n=1 Tax=Coccomyxa viridis TaxID=1274662 RepID=A0AAV1II99_9CHLO|nr:hypothetical protein CVIRNUC_010048 [Coccomyxa viridis]
MEAAEPAALESSHAHIVWALLLTAVAVAFAAIGLGYERRRRFRARVIGQRNQQAVASTAKDIRGQVCGEMAEAKADMPNASVMPRIPPLTSKGLQGFGPTEGVIVIIGSGIAGLSTAASLHKLGIPAVVLEREPAPREEGSAITFWPNAFRVLDTLGVAHHVRDTHSLVHRVEIVDWDGALLRAFGLEECEGAPHDARIVRRSALVGALRSAIPPRLVCYGVSVANVHAHEQGAEVELSDRTRLRCKAVVAADGTKSRVAAKLGLKPAAYAGEVYYRGVATFPEGVPEPPGTLRMMWSARGVRVGMSSISRTQCFWFTTLTCPEAAWMETPEKRKADALESVKGFGFHIQDAIRNTPAEMVTRSRIVDRWLKPGKAFGQGCITVVGDAMHPMTPSLGQGGCIALEDGVKLAQAVQGAGGAAASPAVLAEALRSFERERTARSTPVTVKSRFMGALLQIRNPWFCVVRNWVVRNFYPVHSFLKPAAFDCGPLTASPGATSVATPAPEDPTAVRTPRTEPRQRGKKSAEGVQEQISRDEASPMHRHGTPEDMRNWPSQASLSVIG